MLMDPVIPAAWQGFSLRYRHGEAIYAIQVENPHGFERGVSWVEMDGQRVTGGVVPLERRLVKHQIVVRMGAAEKPGGDVKEGHEDGIVVERT
jgi:cyclic beta-1,2-glucan synthetase